jgi:hypothetical protein
LSPRFISGLAVLVLIGVAANRWLAVRWALATITIGLAIFVLGGFVGTRVSRVLRRYPEPRPSAQHVLQQHPLLALPPLLALLGVIVSAIGLVWLAAWLLTTTLI